MKALSVVWVFIFIIGIYFYFSTGLNKPQKTVGYLGMKQARIQNEKGLPAKSLDYGELGNAIEYKYGENDYEVFRFSRKTKVCIGHIISMPEEKYGEKMEIFKDSFGDPVETSGGALVFDEIYRVYKYKKTEGESFNDDFSFDEKVREGSFKIMAISAELEQMLNKSGSKKKNEEKK